MCHWVGPDGSLRVLDAARLRAALLDVRQPVAIVALADGSGAVRQDDTLGSESDPGSKDGRVVARVPPCPPEALGSRSFRASLGARYACVSGAMANGIGSVELVEAMARGGMAGFFGAAGLSLEAIDAAITRLSVSVGELPRGFNLIHTPAEPNHEAAVVDLYIRRGVRLVEASAFLDLTLPLVRYRLDGIHRDAKGRVVTPNRVVGKASRTEVASKFFAPPPARLIAPLVEAGHLTPAQAELAGEIPMAQDVTAEADSGGHTDNRPALALVPTFIALRDRQQRTHRFSQELRVGAAGGIATPHSAAAAFTLGAAYVVTGSVNQGCVEAGTSAAVREMLAEAEQADVTMAPAPDMFEMGVRVQVLKRGTLFAVRGAKLYELYRKHDSLEEIPAKERAWLEKNLFRAPLESIWQETRAYFLERDPRQAERGDNDAKHRMALVFRWYLGLASRWANSGDPTRKLDYQIWCGPAMGAFNEWARGSFLEFPENRTAIAVALNILHGAAVILRIQSLRLQGVEFDGSLASVTPLEPELLQAQLNYARANA